MPLLDFSTRKFLLVEGRPLTVGALRERGSLSELFVAFDPVAGVSALVIPSQVHRLVEQFGMGDDTSAIDTGLLDAIRLTQMTMRASASAALAAQVATSVGAGAVLAVDESGRPQGVFVPHQVAKQIAAAGDYRDNAEIRRAQVELSEAPESEQLQLLPEVLRTIEASDLPNGHEWLNAILARPYLCTSSSGQHLTSSCPCHIHPDGTCSLQKISPY